MTSIQILFLTYILCHTLLTGPTQSQTISRIPSGSSLIASPNSDSSWKSPSGDFAFGLHPLDYHNLYLLSIWYDKIPDKTIVWYANGDNPAPVNSKVELTSDGKLRLTDPNGNTIWEAQSTTNAAYASLLDTGNFILADDNSSTRYLWQTFDHPTDTILPTQQLQINGILSSRETMNRFSTGRFQLRLTPEGDLVLTVISNPPGASYGPYYRSNTADDSNTMNSGNQVLLNETGILYVVRRNGRFVNLTSANMESSKDFYFRATLEFDGLLTLYLHPKPPTNGDNWDAAWRSIWYEPQNICLGSSDAYGRGPCGYNSICTLDNFGRPSCECLPGFSFIDPSSSYSGCKQEIVQTCDANKLEKGQENYEMRSIDKAFFPTSQNYERFPISSDEECSRACFDDCNCIVVVIRDGFCHNKKLPLSYGRKERDSNGKTFIKVLKNNDTSWGQGLPEVIGEAKDQSTLVLVLSILFGSSLLLNFVLVGASSIAVYLSYQKTKKLNTSSSLLETNLRVFTYDELKEATNGFREQLGRGAFGTVYKGVITNTSTSLRSIVAIKKLEKLVEEGDKEFKTEASVIAKTHHKNLVRLLGFCEEGSNRLLVYEFMSNGTLASFVFGISKPDWNKRQQMAIETARGLAYLHEECTTQIIHCDIKPQNVLLDESFTARISDFGLAKLLMSDQTQTNTMIRGTKGYVAPEWFRSKPVTVKVDVYSYGVLLLEIICCRKNVEMEREKEEEIILTDWAYDCYKARKLYKLIGDEDETRNDMKRVERLVMVGLWCIQEDPSLRPSMKKVVQMLEGVVDISLPPCPSPFISMS